MITQHVSSHSPLSVRADKPLLFIFYLYLGLWTFDGAARYLVYLVGAPYLIYGRDLLTLLAIALTLYIRNQNRFSDVHIFFYAAVFCAYVVIGIFTHGSMVQALFGLKIFIPILMGIIVSDSLVRNPKSLFLFSFLFLFLSFIGTFLDLYGYAFWRGIEVELSDVTLELGMDNQTNIFRRIIGFARTNFQLSTQAYFFAMISIVLARSFLVKLIAWSLGVFIILASTTKGTIALYFISSGFLIANVISAKITNRLAPIYIGVGILAGGILPFSDVGHLMFLDYYSEEIFYLLASFQQRFMTGWPVIIDFIFGEGHWLMGAGIGSVGAADTLFSPVPKGAVDNFYLYAYGTFGIVFLIWLADAYRRTFLLKPGFYEFDFIVFSILSVLFIYGVVSTAIEDATTAVLVGMSMQYMYVSLKQRRKKTATAPFH